MICKFCQATIDDNAQACPYCGTLVTMDVDPGTSSFPDPAAAPQNTVDLSKPAAAPSADDLGLSEPAQYTDPMSNQSTQQPSYSDPAGAAPTDQPSYNSYDQNSYSQPDYSQNAYSGGGYNSFDPIQEKEAQTVLTLGIVATAVGFLCCAPVGPICGGIGISKYSKLNQDLLSEDSKKKANIGRILCIVGCCLGALSMIVGGIMGTLNSASNS